MNNEPSPAATSPRASADSVMKLAYEWANQKVLQAQNRAHGSVLGALNALRAEVTRLAAGQSDGPIQPFTQTELLDLTAMIWGAPCRGRDLALVAVVVKAMEQMNPGERPKDPARGGRLLDWDSLPMDLLEQGAQPMLDKLTATSQGVAVARPDAREAALEQAANLVECEYAHDKTQAQRLAQIAQHIRDLKKRGV